MSEEKLIQQIKEAQQDFNDINKEIKTFKTKLVEMEDRLIETSIRRERLLEELELYRNITVSKVYSEREKDLEGFRDRNPELMEYIKIRDIK